MLSPAPAPEPAPEPEPQPGYGDVFLKTLCDGIHMLSQPLTLLQAHLEAARLLDERDAAQLSALLANDVERACRDFRALQTLVAELGRSWSDGLQSSGSSHTHGVPSGDSCVEGEMG